ncbi:hypothetical protein PSZ91_24140, partial [Shigella sonnei]|nr:hypothetical protein [Shigella sonnei]
RESRKSEAMQRVLGFYQGNFQKVLEHLKNTIIH